MHYSNEFDSAKQAEEEREERRESERDDCPVSMRNENVHLRGVVGEKEW